MITLTCEVGVLISSSCDAPWWTWPFRYFDWFSFQVPLVSPKEKSWSVFWSILIGQKLPFASISAKISVFLFKYWIVNRPVKKWPAILFLKNKAQHKKEHETLKFVRHEHFNPLHPVDMMQDSSIPCGEWVTHCIFLSFCRPHLTSFFFKRKLAARVWWV